MFKSARIKLTLSYIVIILSITGTFSAIVYSGVVRNTERALYFHETRIESRLRGLRFTPNYQIEIDEDTVAQVRKNTLFLLFKVNLLILLLSGSAGYWYAGITLKPIEEMIIKQKKFAADAAHELKTPLTAMKTELEVNLRNPKLNLDKSKELLGSIIEEVDSLTMLTNSLLKQSKYEANTNGLIMEVFELNKVVVEIADKFKEKLNQNLLVLRMDLDIVSVKANKQSIEELITIFLDNAIKFNVPEGHIDISLKKQDKNAMLKIADTGVGLSESDIPFIFDRFYKAESSRARTAGEGFGLGLSIAKEIVDSHKGKINVSSLEGKGTTFIISLPISG